MKRHNHHDSSNPFNASLVFDMLLARFKIYRYFLLFKMLKKYLPQLQHINSKQVEAAVTKTVKNNPFHTILLGALAGVVLTSLLKGGRKLRD